MQTERIKMAGIAALDPNYYSEKRRWPAPTEILLFIQSINRTRGSIIRAEKVLLTHTYVIPLLFL